MTTPNSESESLSDRELLIRMAKQLDHVDIMVHELTQFVDDHKPALARGLALMANPVSATLAKMRGGKAHE